MAISRLFGAEMNNPTFFVSTVASLIAVFFQILPTAIADDELDFYSFTVMDIHDNIVSLGEYRGKVSRIGSHTHAHTHTRSKERGRSLLLLEVLLPCAMSMLCIELF